MPDLVKENPTSVSLVIRLCWSISVLLLCILRVERVDLYHDDAWIWLFEAIVILLRVWAAIMKHDTHGLCSRIFDDLLKIILCFQLKNLAIFRIVAPFNTTATSVSSEPILDFQSIAVPRSIGNLIFKSSIFISLEKRLMVNGELIISILLLYLLRFICVNFDHMHLFTIGLLHKAIV